MTGMPSRDVREKSADKLALIERFALASAGQINPETIEPDFEFARVKITNNCNSRCVTCDYWETHHSNELTLEEIVTVLGDLRKLGVIDVMFTGGEPTMREELAHAVLTAHRLQFETIGVTTNSLSLGPRKIDRLLESGLNEFVFSLEGLKFHDEIRGVPGNTRKVTDNIAYLRDLKQQGKTDAALKIATTLMAPNVDEILDVVEFARTFGATLFLNLIDRGTYFFKNTPVDLFSIRDTDKFSAVIDTLIHIKLSEPRLLGNTVSSLEYARRYFDDPAQRGIACHLGYVGIDIDANGDVYSNCWGLPPVGNIRKTPLPDIVTSKRYQQRCGAMFRKECPGCSCGYILNLSYHKPSVEHDASLGVNLATARIGYAGTKG